MSLPIKYWVETTKNSSYVLLQLHHARCTSCTCIDQLHGAYFEQNKCYSPLNVVWKWLIDKSFGGFYGVGVHIGTDYIRLLFLPHWLINRKLCSPPAICFQNFPRHKLPNKPEIRTNSGANFSVKFVDDIFVHFSLRMGEELKNCPCK